MLEDRSTEQFHSAVVAKNTIISNIPHNVGEGRSVSPPGDGIPTNPANPFYYFYTVPTNKNNSVLKIVCIKTY